jgi:hypothetical protein
LQVPIGSAAADVGQCSQRRVVGVGAARQQPRSMRVPHVVHAHMNVQSGALYGWLPNLAPEGTVVRPVIVRAAPGRTCVIAVLDGASVVGAAA